MNFRRFKLHLLFRKLIIPATLIFIASCDCPSSLKPAKKTISITLNANQNKQVIDGFGVNITPAQWHNGKLKPVIDKLVDDLGATLFRFDCTGLANWLDPGRRKNDGTFPSAYLDSIYNSPVFRDAWETFRYLNHKGIKPFINVSGRIDPLFGRKGESQHLTDFEGYTEMIVSLLEWAREKEKLDFTLFAPFNETDLGYPEGPKIDASEILPATKAILRKMETHGMSDIKLIVPDDSNPGLDKLESFLADSSVSSGIKAFGTHTYGNGDFAEVGGWFNEESAFAGYAKKIKNSPFSNKSVWMTEYGDLDQTGDIEYEFSWRSTRRLMKCLNDGFNAALAWDAFDNFHEHDTAWATYGLFKTDSSNWTYTPKKRYYAAKQIYHFVKPGWNLIEWFAQSSKVFDIYKEWHNPLRNVCILAFASPDKKDFTIIGMSSIEYSAELTIKLENLAPEAYSKKIYYFRTSRTENCKASEVMNVKNNTVKAIINERSIFTITTIH